MLLSFRAVSEASPGPVWAALFADYWPHYHAWWSREPMANRRTYLAGLRALKRHMPEIVPLYEQLCEKAGGGDLEARFLSFYCPPAYLTHCSQAVWPGPEPMLVRNYDYSPRAFEALLLRTQWLGRTVMGMSDGIWGLVDGINDAGLAVSLTFGGRREVGEGFGVPLILRYVLQTCETAKEAGKALARIPTHMSYNVTALDARGKHVTVYVAPDREAIISKAAVATNHQERVEWERHAEFTSTIKRERFLLSKVNGHAETAEQFIGSFLKSPLYSTAFDEGFGTLYTAIYHPRHRAMELRWPSLIWPFDMAGFADGTRQVETPHQVEAEAEIEPGHADAGNLGSRLRRNVSRLFSLK
jgi:predicted choloylglycine hydrolase